VGATEVEGIRAVEPPRLDLLLVVLPHPPDDFQEVLGKAVLVPVVVVRTGVNQPLHELLHIEGIHGPLERQR
jgi:hypothetical protein